MFAVRSALSNRDQLRKDIKKILEQGQADPDLVKTEGTLDFLVQDGFAASIIEAAYRFCRHTPGIGIVLTGTSSAAHLKNNLVSIQGPKLPDEVLKRLQAMFGGVDCVNGQ
jgi:aryl-alcohol dehydrogenase-like predicted oxidoreductase